MSEKRKNRRVEVAWILRLPHRQGGHFQSRTINVSGSGLLFVSPQSFARNEFIAVSMDVSSGLTLKAIIRITRELPGSSRIYTYGAEFVEFADNGRSRLDETLTAIRQRHSGERKTTIAAPNPGRRDTDSKPDRIPRPETTRLNDRRWGPTIEDSPDAQFRR
jgi:hypothetical protein